MMHILNPTFGYTFGNKRGGWEYSYHVRPVPNRYMNAVDVWRRLFVTICFVPDATKLVSRIPCHSAQIRSYCTSVK